MTSFKSQLNQFTLCGLGFIAGRGIVKVRTECGSKLRAVGKIGDLHSAGTQAKAWTEPTNDNFKFDEGEAIIDFGIAHGGSSRGHVFVWHNQVSSFAQDTTDPVALRTILWDNIDTKAAHFRGRLPHWDVVNEAIVDGTSGALRSTLWYNTPGIGYAANGNQYIRESFIRARAADPEALLVYNDYATDTVNSKSTAVYTMLQNFVNAGVPIDAVGFQAHLDSSSSPSLSSVRDNIQRFQALDLDIHVTELDYKLPVDANGIATPANLTAQGDDYFDYTSAALGYSRLKLFQTWGIYDGSSWIPGHTNGESGQALPLDFNFNRKPAYWGMWNALAGQCEKLALVEVSAGDSHTVVTNNTRLGGNGGRRLNADGPNDLITLRAHVPFAGQWSVKVGALKLASGGRFQLSVAAPGSTTFTNVGSVQDTYAASDAAAALTIGNHNFATTGDWQFRFTVSGKNASATDHNLTLDFIRLTPVSCSPAISVVPNQTIEVNDILPPVLFLAEDDFAQGSLQVTASSSNSSLLPSSAIVVTGESPYYRVAASPLANQSGVTVITLTASDGTLTTTRSFTLVVGTPIATVTLGNLASHYDGNPKPVSVTTMPPGLAVDLTYNGSITAPSVAGSYAVVATINDANYQGTTSGTLAISLLPDQHRYLDWQFNETNGTQLNSTVNSGTRTVVDNTLNPPKPTWNFGFLKTQDGVINIGDTQDQKWNPNSAANGGPNGATGHTFRTVNLTAPITGGNIVFEYEIANWNLAGTDGLGSTNNGIGFRVGEVAGSVFNAVNLEFEVSQDTNDIRVQSSTLGSGLTGTAPVSTSVINATALVTGRLYRISTAGDTNWTLIGAANNNVNTLFTATAAGTGTGNAIEVTGLPSNQLGDVNLVGSTTNAVTVQLLANLDTGVWSSRAKVGTSGPWLPLTTDGTGLTQIDRIQLVIDARNGTGWQYGGVQGTATEFVQIDSVTLSAPVTPAVDFASTQLTGDLSQGQTDLPFSLNTPKLPSSATYTGQPLFAALKLQPVGSLATNGASLSFVSIGGMKVEWSGTQGESEAGRYAENDVATGVFVVRRQEFLNGLNTQTVGFNSENDTLAATVALQHQQGRVKSGRFRWVVKDSGNFYISNQVGAELTPAQTPNNSPVTLTSEALSLTWNSYNPWDLNHLNPASFTPVATPAFANIQAIGIWLSATAGANPELTNQAQGLQVTSLAAMAFGATAAIADTVPPVITLIGDPAVTVALNTTYTDSGATATDAMDGTVDLSTNNPVNTAVAGIYTVTYNASDTSGNAATPGTRTVTVTGGGFASWITGTFAGGATVPLGKQGPYDDPDNDGISNLVEYAIAGQDPTVPNPTIGTFTGNDLSYTKRADTSGLTYSIEESTGLVGWAEVSGGSYVNNATTISYTLSLGSPPKNFIRLRVTSN